MILLFLTLAVLGSVSSSFIERYVLKSHSAHAFTVLKNLLCGILFIPIAVSNISFQNTTEAVVALIMAGSLWAVATILSSISTKNTHVSIRAPLGQSRLLWNLLFSAIILKETITLNHFIAVLIIFIGITILLWHPERKFGSLKDIGVRWTLIYAVIIGLTAIADKYALRFFSPEFYGFLAFLMPAAILSFFTPKSDDNVKHLWKINKWKILFVSALSVITYYATLRLYLLLPISVVYPLLQLSTLLTVFGGILFFKEKENIAQKVLAAILVISGAILLKI